MKQGRINSLSGKGENTQGKQHPNTYARANAKKKKNQVRRCVNAEEDLGKIQQENHMQKLHGPLPKLTGRNRKWFCMREREPQLLMYQ